MTSTISLENKQAYFNIVNPTYISWDFYKHYLDVEPDFGKLGLIVFLRTYSRYIPQLKRREKWCETVLRATEYNVGLDNVSTTDELKLEAQKLFDDLFHLRTFLSGRSYWIGNTNITNNHGSPIFNCTYCNIDSISSFAEIYYWLLIGAGAGFSVERKHTKQIPKFFKNLNINHLERTIDLSHKNLEHTKLTTYDKAKEFTPEDLKLDDEKYRSKLLRVLNDYEDDLQGNKYCKLRLYVGDSKEGWVNSVKIILFLHTFGLLDRIDLEIDYSYIRPEGERIKTFGGRSSGYKALKQTIEKIEQWINENEGNTLSSVTIVDILTSIGESVVSGGVRRTAMIALGDEDDEEFISMKKNLWSDPEKEKYQKNRVLSNNSVMVYDKPSKDQLKEIFEAIKTNGDPGFVFINNLRNEAEGTNPCGEIALRSRQCCNLTSLNLVKFVRSEQLRDYGYFDYFRLRRALKRIVRAGSRMTLVDQWHPLWDKNQKIDRLLGQSLTGIMDAFEILGVEDDFEWQKEFYNTLREWVREEADRYHDFLGISHSASTTTIKPEGTLSQLPTVSSGIHRAYDTYFLRNIRFSRRDPMSEALKDLGVVVKPENNQGDDLYSEQCDTWVFEFPVETQTSVKQVDEPAVKQLERYKVAQNNWIESHNVSITVNIGDEEWDDVINWVDQNYESIGNIAMMSKFNPKVLSKGSIKDLGIRIKNFIQNGFRKPPHPNLPYQPLTKQKYEELNKVFPNLKEEEMINQIAQYEKQEEEYEILDSGCSTGGCPIR